MLTITDRDARQFVIAAIEAGDATRDEFDIEAICDDLRDIAGGWDFEPVDHDAFWAVVAKHTTLTATYTQEGRVLVNDNEIDTYDADGGTWQDEVRGVLRRHGYEPVGEWRTDGDDSLITVRDLDR